MELITDDIKQDIIEFLEDDIVSLVNLSLSNKTFYNLSKSKIIANTQKQKLFKKLLDMMTQVKEYPSYSISYSFSYKWNKSSDNFWIIIINIPDEKDVYGKLCYIENNKLFFKFLKYDEVINSVKTRIIPNIRDICFSKSHTLEIMPEHLVLYDICDCK
jgi:hypothetical protein